MQIILGTSSKLRQQAMESLGIPYLIVISNFDEEQIQEPDIDKMVTATAQGKAEIITKQYPEAIVITADSNHLFKGQKYGKPSSLKQAQEWLMSMAGQTQEIHTALIISQYSTGRQTIDLNVATFTLRQFSNDELNNYFKQVDPTTKASGYTPEGPGLVLLDKFEGEPGANLALPLNTLRQRLREFNVPGV